MKKIDIAMKISGLIVAAMILTGLINQNIMTAEMPFIIAGTVLTLVLYAVKAFADKNKAAISAIVILAVFALIAFFYK